MLNARWQAFGKVAVGDLLGLLVAEALDPVTIVTNSVINGEG